MDNRDKYNVDIVGLQEWLDSMDSLVRYEGKAKAKEIIRELTNKARELGVSLPKDMDSKSLNTPYINTISVKDTPVYPGDLACEERIEDFNRWNSMIMVIRANKYDTSIGGHLATYASISTLYEVGFNHFFRAASEENPGDLVFFQGHSSPGIYARSFLEGRLTKEHLLNFRRETIGKPSLSSYPHPRCMPKYWQFPTVSMGLGPIQAIYQAYFMRYLENRGFIPQTNRKVWAFLGDGETDEVESLGALQIATRYSLDNLIFVVNCNLQRLDGPVLGNGQIVQDLEARFTGNGWDVTKVLWGSNWDDLFARDKKGFLRKLLSETVDGEYQRVTANDGAARREFYYGKYPETKEIVSHLSDEELTKLKRGGHDPSKVYAAYKKAVTHKGSPSVILAKSIKGYGLKTIQAINSAHSIKKLDLKTLLAIRDENQIPLTDKQVEGLSFYIPDRNTKEMKYLHDRRAALGGYLPKRRTLSVPMKAPDESYFSKFNSAVDRENSTTMVFVRILSELLKDKVFGSRVVPIICDEARTFGMEGLFPKIGIHSATKQKYIPQDSGQMMYYKEDTTGQILQEGISEAGAFSAWLAAATSEENNQEVMIPFYIYYSMFGFQRVGDLAWAAGDLSARGFLLGATSGRTTLAGEGLQHCDGHSHLLASAIPSCKSYDPTFSYEVATIIRYGLYDMYQQSNKCYYYLTLMNDNYKHPEMPKRENIQDQIIKGMYMFDVFSNSKESICEINLMGSGAILCEVIEAAKILSSKYGLKVYVWSVTSINELAREAISVSRNNLLKQRDDVSYLQQTLDEQVDSSVPVVIATDYIRAYANQISAYIKNPFYSLGTDGFGKSGSREDLRAFFEVDKESIAFFALSALHKNGKIDKKALTSALKFLNIDSDRFFSFDS